MPPRHAIFAIPVIAGMVSGVYLACVGVAVLVGLPWDVGLPWALRALGFVCLGYGAAMLVWVFRFRGPFAVLESTWVTFLKLFRRMPLDASGGRAEPLVVAGPYRWVRHPLYSGVDGLTFGIALLVDHPWAFLGSVALGLWFLAVLAPFEERELRALFGPAYADYARTTRRFLPLPPRR
ncbi:MAG TPA: isoprenylcysteine carboxylmethyltransferase family protein [Thermoplasmata archaeon]|nr:isoprenylcysteine carboxylmethyltransferase family protein [Thermoplasmata archaeon]